MKKILLVDDSALMRSVVGDIINSDARFHVEDKARDGVEAMELLEKKQYDAVVLDANMPKLDGIGVLKRIRMEGIRARVLMCSTSTQEGSKLAMDALELGAIDFVHKPERASLCKGEAFSKFFLQTLAAVCAGKLPLNDHAILPDLTRNAGGSVSGVAASGGGKTGELTKGNRLVALAASTGGPKALQAVIPRLPKNLNAPVVLVQHMPSGFTASLAHYLDSMSVINVKEAEEGDILKAGTVYIAKGGLHLYVQLEHGQHIIHFKDGPTREGVKPCANYMYESLADSKYDEIVCVVLTGMGADGTEGIRNLKKKKKVHVISQNADTCIVYGMPRAVVSAGLSDEEEPLDQIAREIVLNIGVS